MNTIPRQIKIIISIITFTGILALAGLCRAETPDEMRSDLNLWQTTPRVHDTTGLGLFGSLGTEIDQSGLLNASNYSTVIYGTYSPNTPKKWGGGAFVVYNVNSYIGAGLGMDWLGQFSVISGNVTLKVDLHPFSKLGLTNVAVTPFAREGVGSPFGGTGGGSPASITGTGAAINFGHFMGGQFGFGGEVAQWSNAGIWNGTRYHVFLDYRYGF